ncbi:hypothetical protein Tco_1119884 [Tanacetum coccineum]
MSLESFQAHGQAPIGGVAFYKPVAETTRQLPVVEGKGKGIATNEQAALSLLDLYKPKKKSTTDQCVFHKRTLATEDASTRPSAQPEDDTSTNIVRDTSSSTDAKTGPDTDKMNSEGDTEILNVGEEQGEDNKVDLEEKTVELDEGQARSDLGARHRGWWTVPIHQASSSVPPLSTPIIDLTPLKHVSSTIQEPFFTTTTEMTTTTLPPPPPLQQQSSTDPELSNRVSALEKLHDLPHKINQIDNEVVKEAVQTTLQDPLRERFRDLSKAEMKEILHQQMDEFLEATAKSSPQMPSAWKTNDTRDVPSISYKQKTASQSRQPVKDVLILDDVHFSDIEDTDAAHLLKIKPR